MIVLVSSVPQIQMLASCLYSLDLTKSMMGKPKTAIEDDNAVMLTKVCLSA
jgi:hypothetical protein